MTGGEQQRFAANAPLRIGIIGCGRMAGNHIRTLLTLPEAVRITALCDVDALRLQRTGETIAEAGLYPKPALFSDVRLMVRDENVDIVLVATPDFQHGYCAAAALLAGKDVYLEKPTTYTVEEGRLLLKLAKAKNLIVQIGSQQRSQKEFYTAAELVRAGRIGKIKTIKVGLPSDVEGGSAAPMPVPETLDYDRWLGPLPFSPYTEDRVHPQADLGRPGWMRWEPADLGMVANWGAHHIDIAQWAMDSGVPVQAVGQAEFLKQGLWNVHRTMDVLLTYRNGVTLHLCDKYYNGILFEGEKGWLFASRDNIRLPADSPFAPRKVLKALDASDPAILAPLGKNEKVLHHEGFSHIEDWFNAVRTRTQPVAPLAAGHAANTACVIAWAAMKTGKLLHWNPETEMFVDNPRANTLIAYTPRRQFSIRSLIKNN